MRSGCWQAGTVALIFSLTIGRSTAQSPASIESLLADAKVQAALSAARAGEPRTIDDQVRFCEVPAPPFKESVRGDLLKRSFQELGLENVRIDRVGNVLADRPGAAARPRLVLAAHLDTVFPEGTPVKVTRDRSMLRGPGISDNCRGLAGTRVSRSGAERRRRSDTRLRDVCRERRRRRSWRLAGHEGAFQ